MGSLCVLPTRPKNSLTQCWFFWNTTPVTNHWCPPKLIPQIWKYKSPRGLLFLSHIDAFVVDAGPDFLVFQCYSMTTESFVTYFPRNLKNPHLFYSYGRVPLGTHSVGVKQCKREHRFRLLGHIPHALVDDGALCPFSLSEKKDNQRSLKTKKKKTTHSTSQPITVFRGAL